MSIAADSSDVRFIVRQSHLNHGPLILAWIFVTGIAIYLTDAFPWSMQPILATDSFTIKLPLFALPSLILLGKMLHSIFNKKLIFTDDYILFLEGLMSWKEKAIRLHYFNIKEIEIDQTLYQKIFGLGDLIITTVATQIETALCMPGVRKSRVIKDFINKKMQEQMQHRDASSSRKNAS